MSVDIEYGQAEAATDRRKAKAERTARKPKVAPVLEDVGDLPRVVPQNARAPKGTSRYKVRCDSHNGKVLYVLTADGKEADAKVEYLRVTKYPKDAVLAVTPLAD